MATVDNKHQIQFAENQVALKPAAKISRELEKKDFQENAKAETDSATTSMLSSKRAKKIKKHIIKN